MANEILTALNGRIDKFVASVGTGGSYSDNVEALKQKVPYIRCIAFEPYHVRTSSGGETSGSHRIEEQA